MDAEVSVVIHWSAEVEFFDVDAHLAGSFVCIGDGAVNVNFCAKYGDLWGDWVAGIVKTVTAGCHMDTASFCFL